MFRPERGVAWPGPSEIAELMRAIYMEKYHQMNGIPRETLERLLAQTP
jgi:hypothetical protein